MGSLPAIEKPLEYPLARRDESMVDNYHGVMVHDPYRCCNNLIMRARTLLEDPDSEETKDFVEKQMKLTDSVLKTCETKEKLRDKLTKLYDFPKYDAPFRAGDKYFYLHNTGLQPQRVLYIQVFDSLHGEPEVLLDPNTLSEDGTVALNTYAVSEEAKYLAYGISYSGSDWVTIKVMRIEDKTVEADTVSWVKFSSISWTHDGKGFFYSRYPDPGARKLDAGTETRVNLHHELYYHFLGTDQSEDILCWRDPDNPKHTRSSSVTEDGKYVLLYTYENCGPVNKIYYCDLTAMAQGLKGHRAKKELLPFVKLVDTFDASYHYVANDDTIFTLRTNKDAPRSKLVRVDLRTPNYWSELLQEDTKDVLVSAIAVNGNQLVLNYLSDVKNVLQLRDLQTGAFLHDLPLDIGTVSQICSRRKDSIVFIGFTSFLVPGIIYSCNLEADVPKMEIFRENVVPGFDRIAFEARQRPDLFGCALAHVGVMDLLRFHKFTIGHAWTSDFGCSDIEEEFHWLIKYSPLHNVKRPWDNKSRLTLVQYPSTMLLTADHDDRVVPLHSLKLLATMQHVLCTSLETSPQTNPIIGRIERKAGHGAGMPTQKMIDEAADRYSFMAKMVDAWWTD
ncbi:prolyl oligopeptidase [Striga asiatica]|uniref:Prolyl endopeptidase n=1 Tax=Striga asiatica TaxID=4170 RepID=A0A5A7Q1V5_STRAF|nr:prolyl oligopeptidase [Striga asiatica]